MTAGPGLVSPTSDVCKALVVPFFIVPPPRRVPKSSLSNQKPTLPERCKTRNHNRLSFLFKKERARIKKRKKNKQPLSYLMRIRERWRDGGLATSVVAIRDCAAFSFLCKDCGFGKGVSRAKESESDDEKACLRFVP